MEQAFELRKQHQKTFGGGTVALADGKSFDFGKALKQAKDGVIVTSDPQVAERLREVPALREVKPPAQKKRRAPAKAKAASARTSAAKTSAATPPPPVPKDSTEGQQS